MRQKISERRRRPVGYSFRDQYDHLGGTFLDVFGELESYDVVPVHMGL